LPIELHQAGGGLPESFDGTTASKTFGRHSGRGTNLTALARINQRHVQKHARFSPFSQRLHSSQSTEGFFFSLLARLRRTVGVSPLVPGERYPANGGC
jgi:hypothetical protein